jgi:hypothetical protein
MVVLRLVVLVKISIGLGRFSQKHNVKVGRVDSRHSILTKEEAYSYLTKIDIKYKMTTI